MVRMTDACLVSLSHAEFSSASHREPFLSVVNDCLLSFSGRFSAINEHQ